MSIQFSNYASVSDYKDRITSSSQVFYANKLTLIRGAITAGLAPKAHLNITREVLEWKIATMLAFINTSSPFTIKNVSDLETSEKVTVAYFIGMVFAQIQMQKMYNVRHLMHLKSDNITVTSSPGDLKNPDLWGLDYITGQSYLVEAKGSTKCSEYFSNSYVNKAEIQLNAILQIHYNLGGHTTTYDQASFNLNKLIVATHPNINGEIMQHVIDPKNEEQKILDINGDEMVYKHYAHLVKFINNEKAKSIEINNISGVKFKMIDLDSFNCSIGIMENIYEILKPYTKVENLTEAILSNLHQEVNDSLDELDKLINKIPDNDKFSIGIDGIIVIEKN
ncbi:hypothetical protein [Lysinibacillus piscis]|uniref:Uncharacterized protein n=1 Tax=Lysinibacillus piscis TaxID=2518931 RepID=A0ABQ5NMW8_9BACI|nr:hypothetical protein [Lysinibacillus sp. KH24]GLC89700.1 hypothetical protein LYSBPC_28270 [Lysinibacillus sp. KH24]